MTRSLLSASIALSLAVVFAATPAFAAETKASPALVKSAAAVRDHALKDDTGWKVVESLTTEVGQRLAGSEADARAVEWAKAKFKELGFDKVWTQPVTFPKWERRSESGEVLGPHSQKLALTALGGSPGGTVEGEVVRFDSLEALQKAAPGSLAGKIAFVDVVMPRAKDGHGYGIGSRVRTTGASSASRAGAIGYVMRPAGTDWHRNPHTGMTRFENGVKPIPEAALSNPDADQLARLVKLGPTRIRVALDCGFNGEYTSQNVIGEITGRSKPNEIVALGGHLDSWDLGTGAIDDASGIAISMAAAKLAAAEKRPERTIRVVAFANEEQGLYGGRVYAESQKDKIRDSQIVMESDSGPGRVYEFGGRWSKDAEPAMAQVAELLKPLGIAYTPGQGEAESEMSLMQAAGSAAGAFAHDASRYFDLHHTPDDTLDKVDPEDLRVDVAAYATLAFIAANVDGSLGSGTMPAPEPRKRR